MKKSLVVKFSTIRIELQRHRETLIHIKSSTMKETVILEHILPVSPEVVYNAWLNSRVHSEMTGGEAICSSFEGDTFSAWDGYITGTNIRLISNRLIEQAWRTAQFSDADEDSNLKIEFKDHPKGTLLTLTQTNIPEHQTQYIEGWKDNYFIPMTEFFSE